MKHDVLNFVDSNTLREMLRGKEIAPAVECILITKSRKQSMNTKLEALTERAESYTDADFAAGVYHIPDYTDFNGSFSELLKTYIKKMQEALEKSASKEEGYVFQVCHDFTLHRDIFTSFADAVSCVYNGYIDEDTDEEPCGIIRRKINGNAYDTITYYLNEKYEITAVSYYEDENWDIALAFAELPHDYQIGDIIGIESSEKYYVVANICRTDQNSRWFDDTDYGDMSMHCMEYRPDKIHPCGGTFCHAHIRILDVELVDPKSLPFTERPLKGLSMLLKGEMMIPAFLESYSNGLLDDLVVYGDKKKYEA